MYRLNLALIRQIYKTTFNEHPTIPVELVPKIVAQTMHDLCMDTSASLKKISSLAREGEMDAEHEPNKDPLPHRPITAFRSYMSDVEEDGEESSAKSTGPRTPSSKGSPGGPESANKPEVNKPEANKLEAKKPEVNKPEAEKIHLGYTGGKNKVRACPLCEFKGTHLDRHLRARHAEVMSEKEVSRLVALSDHKLQQRGTVLAPKKPKQGQYLYQCGFRGCTTIVSRMSQHLAQAHKLFGKEKQKEARGKLVRLDSKKPGAVPRKPREA